MVFCAVCSEVQKVLLIISVGYEVGRLIKFNRKDLVSVERARFQTRPIIHRPVQLDSS